MRNPDAITDVAYATRTIYDITEDEPIPRGARVEIQDFDRCGGSDGLFIVDYEGRIYLASPDELR